MEGRLLIDGCRTDRVFKPRMKDAVRKELWAGWKEAVKRVL